MRIAGVRRLLAAEPDMLVVSEAADTTEAIHGADGVDVAVVDYHLGDRDGLWLTGFLRRLDPAPRVLIYSAFSDEALAVAAMIAGADGLLSKSAIGEELCLAESGDALIMRLTNVGEREALLSARPLAPFRASVYVGYQGSEGAGASAGGEVYGGI